MNPKIACKHCGKVVTKNNIKRHEDSCLNNQVKITVLEEWKTPAGKYRCPYCGKDYTKNGISTHIWRNHSESGKKHNPNIGFKSKGRFSWNKGLTKENDIRIKKQSEKISAKFNSGEIVHYFLGKKHTEETKMKISEKLSRNNRGGRCKWFKYERKKDGKVFSLQGTWEVRFAKVLDAIDEDWIKIGVGDFKHSYKWIDKSGASHTYTPDFWCPNLRKYFEVKGYLRDDDKVKMDFVLKQNIINLEMVMGSDLKKYEME